MQEQERDPNFSRLCLTLKEFAGLDIGNGLIKITLKAIGRHGRQAQIMVEAPRGLPIVRTDRKVKETRAGD